MDGQTNYAYQPDTPADAIRTVDNTPVEGRLRCDARRAPAELAPPVRQRRSARQERPAAASTCSRRGVQWGRLYYASIYIGAGRPLRRVHATACRRRSASSTRRSTRRTSRTVIGFFVQDAWSMNRLTLNLGARSDSYIGTLPAQSNARRARSSAPRSFAETEALDQQTRRVAPGRVLRPDRQRAAPRSKASYSRYALQVGIDRVTNVNPLTDRHRAPARGPTRTATASSRRPR